MSPRQRRCDEQQQRRHDAGDQADWYLALYCTAIDRVHDSRRALEMADKAIRKYRDGNALAEQVTPEDALSLMSGHNPPMPWHVAEE